MSSGEPRGRPGRTRQGDQETRRPGDKGIGGRCRLAWVVIGLLVLSACALPAALGGPTPTPTRPLAPYNAAVATAEAGSDPKTQAAAYFERGNYQLDQGDHNAAIADYDEAIRRDPTNARAFNNRGLARAAAGQADQALADYAEAIRLDPGYTRAYKNRLVLLEARGDLRAIAADYDRLAALDPPGAAEYRYRQGSALAGVRDAAGARRAFDAALQADPQQVDALYERALLSFAAGRPRNAISDLDAALRLSPRAANAYYARGLAHSAAGDHQQAAADFDQALRLRPDDPAALLGRAAAALALGDTAGARATLDRLETLPLDDTLRAAAAALQRQLGGP